jgi:hypothetical protein
MMKHLIHTCGDLILVLAVDGRPRAYEVAEDGSLIEQDPGTAKAIRESRDIAAQLDGAEVRRHA